MWEKASRDQRNGILARRVAAGCGMGSIKNIKGPPGCQKEGHDVLSKVGSSQKKCVYTLRYKVEIVMCQNGVVVTWFCVTF